MKKLHAFKYLMVLTLPVTVAVSFLVTGWLTYLPLIYAFGIIPLLEFFFSPNPKNASTEEAVHRQSDTLYDWMLYIIVPIQFGFLIWFLQAISAQPLATFDLVGRITAMGMMCGVLGINVAHELGHRPKKGEQFLAKALLMSSLYMHFFIEHNRGHHKNVSTPEDPSSARFNEWLPVFWMRSVWQGYFSAWRLEAQRLKRKKLSPVHYTNEMLQFQVIQICFVALIAFAVSSTAALYFIGAACMGFLLLETVNYIEHYGLQRKRISALRYETTNPTHSWNSNHTIGRLLLFELSRHSDHHYQAAKKYQLLDHYDHSPQMPTGYPGMMLLAAIPPLWFAVMNPRVRHWQQQNEAALA